MKDGDLAAKVAPRILIVFEGAIAFCNDSDKYAKLVGRRRFHRAMGYWELNDIVVRRLLWLYWQKDVNIEVVTYLGEDMVPEVDEFIGETIPCHRVWGTTPEDLGRKIAYMPDLACVYDPEPSRWLMYGSKGRFLDSVTRIGEGM